MLHAVDGTKVLAQASKQTVWTREQVQEGLAQLDAAVEEYMQQAEAAAVEEAGGAGYELPAGWQEQMLRREQLRELAQQLEVEERDAIPETEREARFMRTRQEGSALAYNAQIVADAHSGLIVAAEVLTEGTDNHALVPMLEQVQDHVGAVAQQTVADAGYLSGEQLSGPSVRGARCWCRRARSAKLRRTGRTARGGLRTTRNAIAASVHRGRRCRLTACARGRAVRSCASIAGGRVRCVRCAASARGSAAAARYGWGPITRQFGGNASSAAGRRIRRCCGGAKRSSNIPLA